MEIRGLTLEQIEEAVKNASEKYGGNIELIKAHYPVKLDKPIVTEHSYTRRAQWRVMCMVAVRGEAGPDEWTDYGYEPYVHRFGVTLTPEEVQERERQAVQEKVAELRQFDLDFPSVGLAPMFYKAEWVPEHEVTYTTTQTHEYVYAKGQPLNKRGDGWRVKFKPLSSRRPGARVGSARFTENPRRIASVCWHAHRDIFRAMFAINPDTKIKTALAYYQGEDDFEDKYPSTAYGHGVVNAAPIECIGDLCNCDEGEYPEYATEGLTPEQYDDRVMGWDEGWSGIKKPSREKALLPQYRGEDAA